MVLYQLRSQDQLLRSIWLILSLIKIQQREENPNINIVNSIHKIKGKTSVNILVSNYNKKHITFNKGEYIGCLESALTDDMTIDQPETHSAHSVTLQKMDTEQVNTRYF